MQVNGALSASAAFGPLSLLGFFSFYPLSPSTPIASRRGSPGKRRFVSKRLRMAGKVARAALLASFPLGLMKRLQNAGEWILAPARCLLKRLGERVGHECKAAGSHGRWPHAARTPAHAATEWSAPSEQPELGGLHRWALHTRAWEWQRGASR